MATVYIRQAVSVTDPDRDRYCLLHDDEIETYRCAEAAENLGATAKDQRLRGYWLHYKTHIEPYTRWAEKKGLFDPTVRYPDPRDGAIELVAEVLLLFRRKVEQGLYDPKIGPPCKYVKRSIRHKFQDILRKGHHPTQDECAQCWEENGACPVFGVVQPRDQERQRCSRLPRVEGFDATSAVFAAAGLQDEWPPTLEDAPDIWRPVEEQALNNALIACIWGLMPRVLTADQQVVLTETFLGHKTSREIAQMIKTTPGNVDQIRHRGLGRLYRALNTVP